MSTVKTSSSSFQQQPVSTTTTTTAATKKKADYIQIAARLPGITDDDGYQIKIWYLINFLLLFCIGNISYLLGTIYVVYLVPLVITSRDQFVAKQTTVEYNYQTKVLAGIVCHFVALYIINKPILFLSQYHTSIYCAYCINIGYQMYDLQYTFKYCRPIPIEYDTWETWDEYVTIPSALLLMTLSEHPMTFLSPSVLTMVAKCFLYIKLYRFITSYYKITKLISLTHQATVPMKNPNLYYSPESIAMEEEMNNNKKGIGMTGSSSSSNTTVGKNVWNIYGNQYDMTNFVHQHPGGVEAILLGANRDDCTGLIQAYHPFTIHKVKTILRKYQINNNNHKNDKDSILNNNNKDTKSTTTKEEEKKLEKNQAEKNDKYLLQYGQHDNDYFYNILCDRVYKGLVHAGIDPILHRGATYQRYFYYLAMASLVIISGYIHCFYDNILGSIVFGVAGWFLGAMGHDGGHFAVSRKPWINEIGLWGVSVVGNPIMWQHQHTYGHHIYTNELEKDPDLHHFDLVLRYHKNFIPNLPKYKKQINNFWVLFCWMWTVYGVAYACPTRLIYERTLYNTVPWADRTRVSRTVALYAHLFVHLGIVQVMPFFTYENSWKALFAVLTTMATTSLCFSFASQVGHINEVCVSSKIPTKDGGDTKNSHRHPIAQNSWAADQIESTNDFAPESNAMHFLANALSLQIEHHLFPGINHCHLQTIQPIVEQTCKEYGVKYVKHESFTAIINSMFDYLHTLAIED